MLMYATLRYQLPQLVRFGLSFALLFVAWPVFVWRDNGPLLDRFWRRLVWMLSSCIALVYLLAATKLYELLAFTGMLLLVTMHRLWFGSQRLENIHRAQTELAVRFYGFLDSLANPGGCLVRWLKRASQACKRLVASRCANRTRLVKMSLLAVILGYAAYLRYYDAVVHAAPAMSDAYVTLAWTKYINRRILFHDGIYPQGFHIYLSVLHKFAGQDPFFTLKYAGPLNGVLTALGLYWVAERLGESPTCGLLAAFVYGVLGGWLPLEWQRQASTNSQEFALVFLLPAIYMAHQYLQHGERCDWWAALCGALIMGWVHALIYGFFLLGMVVLGLAHLLANWRHAWKRMVILALGSCVTGLLSLLPVALGLVLGRGFHGSSAEFMTATITVAAPVISPLEGAALLGFALYLMVTWIRKRRLGSTEIFLAGLGATTCVMYLVLGPLTGNAVLATRTGIFWAPMVAVGSDLGWSSLVSLWPAGKKGPRLGLVCCALLLVGLLTIYHPSPAAPYKMQYDSAVEQVLLISQRFLPTEWMLVSAEEGYALALGKGYHLMLGDFIAWYNPTREQLIADEGGAGGDPLTTPDIFILGEKTLFVVEMEAMKAILARREQEYRELGQWVKEYGAYHDNLSIFYEDDDIVVYRIHHDIDQLRAAARRH